MRILITGGAGFIGSHIADRMLSAGHDVMVYDNYSSGSAHNNAYHPKLRLIAGDVAEKNMVLGTFELFKPDTVIHCANQPVTHPVNPVDDIKTNVIGTCNVIEAAKAAGVKRIIYFQTALIYGAVNSEIPVKTDQPVNPRVSYSITKLAAENYIRNSGLNYIIFRLANQYGPRSTTGAFPAFFKRLSAGDPCTVTDERRTFIYVQDTVDLVEKAINLKYPSGVYHVSCDKDYMIFEVLQKMQWLMGRMDVTGHQYVKSADDSMKVMRLDWKNTAETFDWKAKIKIEEGIKRTINWYKENGVGKIYTQIKNIT